LIDSRKEVILRTSREFTYALKKIQICDYAVMASIRNNAQIFDKGAYGPDETSREYVKI